MRYVEVVPYKESWAARFETEARSVREALNHLPVRIHHIGSTSVPGLSAKPVIDLMPVVERIEDVDAYTFRMEEIGYEAMGAFGIEGRRFFKKGGDARTHHVHVFEIGSPHEERHLAFRDFLIAHPETATIYGELKRELAARHPEDMDAYIRGKEKWVRTTEQKAIQWYREERK